MSGDDADSTVLWVAAAIGLGVGIVFFFSKSVWPELDQPVLRCLVAPFAGIAFLIAAYLYSVFYSVASEIVTLILSKLFLLLTAPALVFVTSLVISLGIALFLSLGWIVPPVMSWWASINAVALGTVGGFMTVGLVRVFRSGSQGLQIAISSLVAIGLTYWMITKLQPGLAMSWIITTIVIVIIFLGRLWYDMNQRAEEVANTTSPRKDTSYAPEEIRGRLLMQIRDQIGVDQYDRWVSTIGEDEIINRVLASMQKSSEK